MIANGRQIPVSPSITPGTVFMASCFAEAAAANRLTIAALDAVAKIPRARVCAAAREAAGSETSDAD